MKSKIMIIAMLLAAAMPAQAQNVTRPKIACPNGVWVNSYNGVLFYQRADLSIPNRQMPLEAVFYYNSSSNATNYGFGNGWSLGYEYRYIVDSLGIIVESGDGRQDLYTVRSSEGGVRNFMAPAGVFDTLVELASGGFKLEAKDGTVRTFADTVSKRITRLEDRNGNALTFDYTGGQLTALGDGNGRNITLAWNADGLLAEVATNLDDRRWQYAYDTLGNLASVTNPMGYSVYYGYDRANRLCRLTYEEGYSTHITYNDDGMAHRVRTDLTDKSIRYEQASRQTVIVDYVEGGNNQFTTYRWDTLGRVIEKTGNCCGFTSRLEYDADNNVISSEDANGNTTRCTYDGDGNMLSLTDPLGYTEHYTYTPAGDIATFTDKLGNQYTFTYDTHRNLTAINGPMGNTTSMAYDTHGQMTSTTDANGNITSYGYDQYGNRISVTDAAGKTAQITYTPFGLVSTETSPKGDVTRYYYDQLDRLTATIDPYGNQTRYAYDAKGNVTTVWDANNLATTIKYDALDQPTAIANAGGDSIHYAYNAKQKVVERRVGHTLITRYVYDDRDRLVAEIAPNGDTTTYSYDGLGNVVSLLLPNGREVEYTYDAMGRLVEQHDQYGSMGKTVYTAYGDILASISANGDSTAYTYDALRQITSVKDPMGNTQHYSYDANGNVLTYTDAMGQTLTYTYNALDMIATETDALNNVTTYSYDDDGNLSSVTDANGNTTTYQHDANDNLTLITFANGTTKRMWYDGAGNRIKEQDESGNVVQYVYDAAERLIKRILPDGTADVFTYNSHGALLTATNSEATVTFSYYGNGMLQSETMNGKTTSYKYDTRRNTITITYPGGRSVVEQYDLRNRLQYVVEGSDTVAAFEYDNDNYLHRRTYNNGTSALYTFDANKQLIGLSDGPSVIDYAMQYDADGNMTAKISNMPYVPSETYQYDAIHRLTGFKRGQHSASQIPNPTRNIQYALDALGNRTSVSDNGIATPYQHNNTNAYSMVSNNTMQYDANGNLTSDGTHIYQYDYNNNIVSVDSGATSTYKYDALNRRIEKQTGSDTIRFYYSGYRLLEERDGGDIVKATYIVGRGVDNVLQMERSGSRYYYHRNHLGSVVAITDNEGIVVERYEYDPYGNTIILNAAGDTLSASAIGNRYMFTSREYDAETGLYYFRARSMHPSLGRFLQADPMLYIDGYNYYTYVGNMPLRYIDADGNRNMVVDFFIGGCLDLIEGWQCATAAQRGWNMAMCAMDIAGLIPGVGLIGKGVKGIAKGMKYLPKVTKMAKGKIIPKLMENTKRLFRKTKPEVCMLGGSFKCGFGSLSAPYQNLKDGLNNSLKKAKETENMVIDFFQKNQDLSKSPVFTRIQAEISQSQEYLIQLESYVKGNVK